MKDQNNIKDLLIKFAANQCTNEEIKILIEYFQNSDDDAATVIPDLEEIEHIPVEPMSDEAAERIFSSIQDKVNRDKKKRELKKYYWAAAVIALLLSTGIFLKFFLGNPQTDSFDVHGKDITLVDEDGNLQVIDPTQVKVIATAAGTAEQDRTTLVFNADGKNNKLVFNTLRVPYGKTFRIVLSDGSSIDLNAGTSVTFPVNFIDSEPNREVTIIGEAFFKVARNENQPFIVHTGEMDVNVLGTEFNVSNYPENKTSDVVLVKGAVSISENSKQMSSFGPVTLTPGEKGTFHRESGRVKTEKVTTGIYTAWLDGELVLRNSSFANILKMLERRYNVEIVNHNKQLENEEFNTSFKEETVEGVLDYFKMTYGITYTRTNNKIIIN